MKNISWLMVFGSIALLGAAPACGSDDSSGSGGSAGSGTGGAAGSGTGGVAGGSGTHAACTGAAAKVKALAASLGCPDNSADIATQCEQLYTAGKCTSEFEAFIGCASSKADSDWACGTNGPELNASVCDTEQTALNTCVTT